MRTDKAWENYKLIGSRSPINPLTEKLVSKLNDILSDVCVMQVMRYTPFASESIKELKRKKIKDVILFLYIPNTQLLLQNRLLKILLKLLAMGLILKL